MSIVNTICLKRVPDGPFSAFLNACHMRGVNVALYSRATYSLKNTLSAHRSSQFHIKIKIKSSEFLFLQTERRRKGVSFRMTEGISHRTWQTDRQTATGEGMPVHLCAKVGAWITVLTGELISRLSGEGRGGLPASRGNEIPPPPPRYVGQSLSWGETPSCFWRSTKRPPNPPKTTITNPSMMRLIELNSSDVFSSNGY